MERGSPESLTSSSLEQSELTLAMPHSIEKRPRLVEAEEQISYLALLTGAESPEAHQIETSIPKPPIFTPFGNLDVDAQQNYWMPNQPTTPTTLSDFNLSKSGPSKRPPTGSTLKRKKLCEDDITPNPNTKNFFGGDQRYNSSSYSNIAQGYTVYDERYQTLGLPVDPHLRMFNAIYGKGKSGFS